MRWTGRDRRGTAEEAWGKLEREVLQERVALLRGTAELRGHRPAILDGRAAREEDLTSIRVIAGPAGAEQLELCRARGPDARGPGTVRAEVAVDPDHPHRREHGAAHD